MPEIKKVPSEAPPSPEFMYGGQRYTAATPRGLTAIPTDISSILNTPKITVPPEALITLGTYQIISQEWLSKQVPLAGFFEEGQSLNPTLDQTDNTKRQCWLDDGIYRYNQLGSDWTLRQLGASTLSYDKIINLYKIAQGKKNVHKMKNMGVIATGWRSSVGGRVEDAGFAYLRSGSADRNGGMLAAKLRPDGSGVGNGWFGPRTGIVPFGVMDKTVSA